MSAAPVPHSDAPQEPPLSPRQIVEERFWEELEEHPGLENEWAYLSTCMHARCVPATRISVRPEHLSDPRARAVLEALQAFRARGQRVSGAALRDELEYRAPIGLPGGWGLLLTWIYALEGTSATAEENARRVVAQARAREIRHLAQALLDDPDDPEVLARMRELAT